MSNPWIREEPTVGKGGDCGGDIQIGEAFNARWTQRQPDGTYRTITRSYYGAQNEDESKPAYLERQTEYITFDRHPDGDAHEINGHETEYQYVVAAETFTDDTQARQAAVDAPEADDDEWQFAADVHAGRAAWTDDPGLIMTWDYL